MRHDPGKRLIGACKWVGGIAALAAALGGCVSLLPQPAPAQLYQIGRQAPAGAEPATPPASGPGVALTSVTLPRAALGDQILTLTGNEAAYVADARWATPAVLMIQEDAERAFDDQAHRVRLLHRGDGAAAALLSLDVADFEARYDAGAGAPPTILVSLRASLTAPDGSGLRQQSFTARQAASENRVGAIVQAFDAATTQVLGQVVAWTDASAPQAAPSTQVKTTTTSTTSTSSTRPPN